MKHLIALGLGLLLGFSTTHAQPAEKTAPSESTSDWTPGPWEVTAQVSYLSGWYPLVARSRGISLRAGYRPTASRRGLVEVYGLHIPQGASAYSSAEINGFGTAGTFLGREAGKRINPYVAVGAGFWHVDAQPLPPCRPEDGCMRETSSWFEDTSALSAVAGAGLYVAVVPAAALRADARIYAPLAIGGDRGSPHPVLSVGLSIRP